MARFLSVLVIVAWCGTVLGSSIFDDDYTAPKDPPAAKPSRPSDSTPPANARPRPDQPDKSPGDKANAPADSVPDKQSPNQDPWAAAMASAQESVRLAEARVDQALEKNTAYVAAVAQAKTDAEKGQTDSPAFVRAQHLRDDFLAKDAEYQFKKRYLIMLTRLSPDRQGGYGDQPTSPKTEQEFRKTIDDAIAAHTLIEGMSFREACKAARKPVELAGTQGTRKTYHWILKGSTGSYQETHRDFRGNIHSETVPTYGVIGHVVGVFDDDYLVSFAREK